MKKVLLIFCVLLMVSCSEEDDFQSYVEDRVWLRAINSKRIIYMDSKGRTYGWKGLKGVKPTLKNILTPEESIGTKIAKGWRFDYNYTFENDSLILKKQNRKTMKFKLGKMSDTISNNIHYLKFTVIALKHNKETEEMRFYSKKLK